MRRFLRLATAIIGVAAVLFFRMSTAFAAETWTLGSSQNVLDPAYAIDGNSSDYATFDSSSDLYVNGLQPADTVYIDVKFNGGLSGGLLVFEMDGSSQGQELFGGSAPYTITNLGNGITQYKLETPLSANATGIRFVWEWAQTDSDTMFLYDMATSPGLPAPTGLTATAGDQSVALAWNAVSGATSYDVFQNGTEIKSGITGTSYTVSGLTGGTTYNFSVAATGNGQTSVQSTSVSATPLTPMPAPTNITTTGTPGGTGTVSWKDPTAPAGTTYTVSQNGQPVATTTGTSATVTNYDPNSTYTVSASAPGYVASQPVAPPSGLNWGMTVSDVLSTAGTLLYSLRFFLLLGLAFILVPWLIHLIRRSDDAKMAAAGPGVHRDLGYSDREDWAYEAPSPVDFAEVDGLDATEDDYTGGSAPSTYSEPTTNSVSRATTDDRYDDF